MDRLYAAGGLATGALCIEASQALEGLLLLVQDGEAEIASRRATPPVSGSRETPTALYFNDGWGDLYRFLHRAGVEGQYVVTDSDDTPEELCEDAPLGWSVFDGTIRALTTEDIATGEYEPCIAGDEWWSGRLRAATVAEVASFFRLRTPAPGTGTEEARPTLRDRVLWQNGSKVLDADEGLYERAQEALDAKVHWDDRADFRSQVDIHWVGGAEDTGYLTTLEGFSECDMDAVVHVPKPWAEKGNDEPVWITLMDLAAIDEVESIHVHAAPKTVYLRGPSEGTREPAEGWATDEPTEPGWYWTRTSRGHTEILRLTEGPDGKMWADDGSWCVDEVDNEWCGPLPAPPEHGEAP